MSADRKNERLLIEGKELKVVGCFPRLAQLRSEYFQTVEEPAEWVNQLASLDVRADIFTFVQRLSDLAPRYPYRVGYDRKAVIRIGTYEHWWTKQINDKTRNMVRRAGKKGASIEIVPFDDRLVEGIKQIYDESPTRQGRPFPHFGKDLATLKRDHASYVEISDFIGAFFEGVLIGFAKVVHVEGCSIMMQIISKNAHRDKSPTNALIAKAVELCAARNVPCLMYGKWSKRGLGDFKKHHGFECLKIPRYFVPLTWRGKLAMSLRLHEPLVEMGLDRVPERWLNFFADLRSKWYSFRFRSVHT